MRSSIWFFGGAVLALVACSETATPSTVDASVVDASVVDVTDVTDVTDAPIAMDRNDVPPGLDVVDVPRVDVPPPDIAPDIVPDIAPDIGVRCVSPETACPTDGGAACFDLRADVRHCGACGHACCTGQWCASGFCVTGCPAGQTVCTSVGATCPVCLDLSTSNAHCGACNHPCAEGHACVLGICVAPTCAAVTEPPPPMGQCDGRGRIACEMWAQGIAGGRPTVTAQCLTSPSGCAKADRCDDPRDASTCRCGAEPSCGPNQVCELVGPTARCRCARP